MIIRVKNDGIEKDISEADPGWGNQQINGRRVTGEVVCVQVTSLNSKQYYASEFCQRLRLR